VPGLGRHSAGDATARSARAEADAQAVRQGLQQGLPRPSGGRKEYRDDDGTVTEVVEGFGYKLPLVVDVEHEVPWACHATDTQAGDHERVGALLEQAQANLPAGRIEPPAHGKAADDAAAHEDLAAHGIKPVIRNRAPGREEPERPRPPGRSPLHLAHDEAGTGHCYDTVSGPPVRQPMAYAG
jgi:hypothetical protein